MDSKTSWRSTRGFGMLGCRSADTYGEMVQDVAMRYYSVVGTWGGCEVAEGVESSCVVEDQQA
jgi:hypothetical protein